MCSSLRSHLRAGLLVGATTASIAACARNPVTGDRELSLVSESQEIQIGRQGAEEVVQSLGLVNDDALQAYVQRLGASLADESERPDLPWTFRVVDDPTPNAFALPGGFIFITRGLMNLMDSESELASVLGHEIGHVTAKHSVQAMSRQQVAQLGLGIGSILSPTIAQYGELAGTGLGLLFLKYGRDAERQADDLGFGYALDEGYDVRQMDDVFATLQRVSGSEGQSPLPSWLATHPYPEERIQRTQERLAGLDPSKLTGVKLGRAEYLGQIDGLVYGENPRNGFFQDGVFLHPELRFRLSFPQQWRTQNLPQAVVGISPQQDAVTQLTLAGQAGARAAAQQFLSQQGIQPGQATQQNINGIPAVASYFQAQTQQGVIRGLASFFEYGGRTYQLLSYAPAQQFDRYDQLFRQIVGSFAPVTDPQVLNVRPPVIDIVRLDRAMTLGDFNRQYPSVVPLEELALINQVADANSQIAAGTLVKRVVTS